MDKDLKPDLKTDSLKPLDLATIKSRLAQSRGKQYWRTLGELAETPEFMEVLANEVPQSTRTMHLHMDRRQFLTLAGASLALAGLSGCRYLPQRTLVPYVHQPEELVQGIPMRYATAVPLHDGYGSGAIVTAREGRPIKIEGNPDHPSSLGATDAWTQAAILPLYDPDRSQIVMQGGEFSTWRQFFEVTRSLIDGQRKGAGAGLRILTQTVTSPTLAAQLQAIKTEFPAAQWVQFEPAGAHAARAAAQASFGQYVGVVYNFAVAKRIVSLDADFLLTMPGSVRYARDYMNSRKVRAGAKADSLNRLYVFESTPSITGGMADHKYPVRASEIESYARAIAHGLGLETGGTPDLTPEMQKQVDAIVKDLQSAPGAALVVPGDFQSPAVHVLAHAINDKLGAVGKTVAYTDPIEAAPQDQFAALRTLISDMKDGKVDMLLILGGNPIYNTPPDLDFATALNRVAYSAHLGLYEDETSLACKWHLPESHFLEAWTDLRGHDGTVSLVQPIINPLYDSKSIHELLSGLFDAPSGATNTTTPAGKLDEPRDGYAIVRQYWTTQGYTDELAFNKLLHDGIIPNTAARSRTVTFNATALTVNAPTRPTAPNGTTLEISIRPDPTIWDGRHANNGWLQELPKPFTKLVWDNAAYMSVATAKSLNIPTSSEDIDSAHASAIVAVTIGDRKIVAPVFLTPGHPDNAVTLFLGYGRSQAGQIGTDIGYNAYKLVTSAAPWGAITGTVEKTGDGYDLATTQHHHLLEGRDIIRSGSISQFIKRPSLAPEDEVEETERPDSNNNIASSATQEDMGRNLNQPNLYPSDQHRYPQDPANKEESFGAYAWGVSVDIHSCIGCNACMVACQAENNIPVVGKEQVLTGRHMNWIRIDTYYKGDVQDESRAAANPEVYFQPMMCQQCEQAPCEPVCPVGATIHSHEGLNQMVYNRCIGTRYCSNNCPYKVRRFNFLNFANNWDAPVKKMLYNPEVTVRGRGVMEKCTFCVQRINVARQRAKIEGREVRDGEIKMACEQACPTEAIVFGNINDKTSKVFALKTQPHNFGVLADLNTRPRISYLGRVTNPNPDLVTETEQHGG
jgi:MoCo/4Fe-4S cofactor protein with predicted Tat translocation signal